MKTQRQIIVSILLTASLLAAPLAVAQPNGPSIAVFDLAGFFADLVDDIRSIFAPAGSTFDPNGMTSDGDEDGEESKPSESAEKRPIDRAGSTFDPNG